MRRTNIISLVQYSHPEEIITKQIRKEANNKFYKRLSSLKSSMVRIKKINPKLQLKKSYSLPKLNLHLSINNSTNEKIPPTKEKSKVVLNTREKNKFMTFEQKMMLNYYEHAISSRMKAKPKKVNDFFFRQFKSNFEKSKKNYRKIEELKLNKENSIYKKVIKRFSDNYANFSNNKFVNHSYFALNKKFKIKIV